MNKTKFVFTSLLFLSACSIKMYVPSEENLKAGVSLADLTEGRTLYLKKCGECHDLHHPNEYSHDEWIFEVNKMQPKAKISDGQKDLILKYLWNAPPKKSKHQ